MLCLAAGRERHVWRGDIGSTVAGTDTVGCWRRYRAAGEVARRHGSATVRPRWLGIGFRQDAGEERLRDGAAT